MQHPYRFLLFGVLFLVACSAENGGSCQSDGDCPAGLCLKASEGYPDGACSQACESAACAAGLGCRAVGDRSLCLPRCSAKASCRSGYQCVEGLCQPPCRADGECGLAKLCQRGACVDRPGAPTGADCGADDECSSGVCSAGACAQLCARDGACPDGQTCAFDRTATELRATCIDRRGSRAPIELCGNDGDCDRGSCLMGACLQLCETVADCEGDVAARSCTGLPAPLRGTPTADWPELRTCLPRNQTFAVSIRPPLVVPRTARSVLLLSYTLNYDEGSFVGLASLQDPEGAQLYRTPVDQASYAKNVIRSAPDSGSSSLLLSSSPVRAPLRYGVYPFQSAAQDRAGIAVRHDVRAYYQLYDGPLKTARVPLRIHVTDLSGLPSTCAYRTLNAGNAPVQLAVLVRRLKEVFLQQSAGLLLDPITFVDSDASPSVSATDAASLRAVLRAASRDTVGGLDLVLVRSISPNGVLGIAGGIPASPGLVDSPHTGAVASVSTLCIAQLRKDQEGFALIVAHELGHTMGLSHNREMGGTSDPLGDGTAASESYLQAQDNLMYWSADSYGSLLTKEQGSVTRSMPQVAP